eukprot:m.139085 g.139085  ORF g.139085 m.139085 type:complete len:488 (+) comp16649_c0_seq2:109-1572(+)
MAPKSRIEPVAHPATRSAAQAASSSSSSTAAGAGAGGAGVNSAFSATAPSKEKDIKDVKDVKDVKDGKDANAGVAAAVEEEPRLRETVLVDVGHKKRTALVKVIPDLNQAKTSFHTLSHTCRKVFLVTLIETIYLIFVELVILLLGEFIDFTSIEDRRVFNIYFGGSAFFCLALTYHAMLHQSMSEVFGLLFMKLVDVVFAAIQTYQLLAAAGDNSPWRLTFILADIQPFVLGAYCAFLYKMIYPLYYEFGQALYLKIGSNKDVNEKVFSYNNLRVGVIVNGVMNTLFHGIHGFLVRQQATTDFTTSVFFVLLLLPVSVFTWQSAFREWAYGLYFCCVMYFAATCYYGFQVYIFDGRHCDYCQELESSFVLLTLFSIFNIICMLSLFWMTIKCSRTFGKGLNRFVNTANTMEAQPADRAHRRKLVRSSQEPPDVNKRFPFLTPDYKIQTVTGQRKRAAASSSRISYEGWSSSLRWLYSSGVPQDLEV